jgi:hypothetical protein
MLTITDLQLGTRLLNDRDDMETSVVARGLLLVTLLAL